MFKSVFSKLFRPSAPSQPPTNNIYNGQNRRPSCHDPYSAEYDRAPVYAIPTISQSFQGNASERVENSSQRSTSSISSSSSASYNNQNFQSSSSNKKPSQPPTTKGKNTARLNESSIQQIYIAPHCIHYTNSTSDDTIYRIDDESLNEIAAEILESDNSPPKLQIVHYGDRYFAINNSHLQIYKQLQISGLITHVQADVINIEAIPFALRQHLFQTAFDCVGHHHHHHQMNNDDVISDEDLELSEEAMAAHAMAMGMVDCDYNNQSELGNNTACSSASSKSSSSAASSGIGQILSADVLSPSTIEMLSKEMLIDETYEFGACENCVESEHEEEEETEERVNRDRDGHENEEDEDEEDEYGNFENGDYVRASSNYELDNVNGEHQENSEGACLEENFRLNLRLDNRLSLKSENGGNVQSTDVEIIKYLAQDDGKILELIEVSNFRKFRNFLYRDKKTKRQKKIQ
jgi:hypothetical protein